MNINVSKNGPFVSSSLRLFVSSSLSLLVFAEACFFAVAQKKSDCRAAALL